MEISLHIILGIFLLILSVSGNFIAETMGCEVRKLLTNNLFAKNLIIILLTYFSLGLVANNTIPPIDNVKNTLMIWISFIMFNKMSLPFTILAFSILIAILGCKNMIDYYNTTNKKLNNKKINEKINTLTNAAHKLLKLDIFIIIIGFMLYFKKQYKEHNKTFSFVTFLFGKLSCDSN